jgi:hypothetical protein
LRQGVETTVGLARRHGELLGGVGCGGFFGHDDEESGEAMAIGWTLSYGSSGVQNPDVAISIECMRATMAPSLARDAL